MIIRRTLAVLPLGFGLLACPPPPAAKVEPSLPILGGEAHDLSTMLVEELLNERDGLNHPTDLELQPQNRDELWVTNHDDSSITIAFGLGSADQRAEKRNAPGNTHFLPLPMSLAFGDATMATIHAEDAITQPTTPADFMGPSLWSSNADEFDGGQPSHLDMLHNSPGSTGIAWDTGNVFWVFDGFHSSITRYDFARDHGPGQDDHSDGIVQRMLEGEMNSVAGVASHMALDHDTGLLYIADTGNSRIAVLDTATGEAGSSIFPNYDGSRQTKMTGCEMSELVVSDGEEFFLQKPAGLALHDDKVFISDWESGEVQAFSKDGEPLGYLQTGLKASIMGIEFDDEGRLLVVDSEGNRVLRLSPK